MTVNFKTNSGENNSRRFEKNEGVSIYGKCTGVTGIGEPGTNVRLNITMDGMPFYFDETLTDFFGDYDFWFRTPNQDANLNIELIATYSISGQDRVLIPVSVGNKTPKPLPLPEIEGSFFQYLPIILLIGLGIVLYQKL